MEDDAGHDGRTLVEEVDPVRILEGDVAAFQAGHQRIQVEEDYLGSASLVLHCHCVLAQVGMDAQVVDALGRTEVECCAASEAAHAFAEVAGADRGTAGSLNRTLAGHSAEVDWQISSG